MNGYRKFGFGLAIGLPYLLACYLLAMAAIQMGRDLTATGVMIGAIGAALCGVMALFVKGNVQEQQEITKQDAIARGVPVAEVK